MASDKAELSSENDNDKNTDEEYIPPQSVVTPKATRKRKRQIFDSSEAEENDDDAKHNENRPLPRRKKRKLTPTKNADEPQNVSNNNTQNRNESEEDCKHEAESYFCENIDEGAMIKMADFVEYNHQQNAPKNALCQEPDCKSVTICSMYLKHFEIYVCRECKWKPKYKCLSKTNAKKQYLLSEGDINALNCWIKDIKKNNHNESSNKWMPKYMKLYLIYQLEELAIEKYGSKEGIEAERNRREVNRMQRAISNARKKRKNKFECLADIEIDKKVIEEHESKVHMHTFGEAHCTNEETDEWSKECNECDYVETWEEF